VIKGTRGIAGALLIPLLLLVGCGGGEGEVDRKSGDEGLPSALGERVRIEVLNGGGRPGMARLATEELRARGFDVVYFGNGTAVELSEVVDRVDRPGQAREVARALGVENVRSAPDSTRFVDVTVMLGPEWSPTDPVGEGLGLPEDAPDDQRMPRSGG
jgi:hypothetical protein